MNIPTSNNKWWSDNIDQDLAEAVIKFKLVLNGKEVYRDWRRDVSINYETLEDDLANIPSIYAFWSSVLAEAKKKARSMEISLEITKSKIRAKINKELSDAAGSGSGPKMTREDKDGLINIDPDYVKLQTQHIEVEFIVSKLYGIVDSLKMKADSVRSLSSIKRAELNNQ